MLLMPRRGDAPSSIRSPRRRRSRSSARSPTRVTREPYAKRPAAGRPARRGVPALDGHRRHGLLRARVRVLRLRRRSRTSIGRQPLALRGRLGRGPLELGRAGPRLHGARRRRATSRRRRTTRCTTCAREMVLTLERLGIPCEFHHHEVASGGQCEIDLRFQTLTRMADQVMTYKYVVKNVARARTARSVTFMPKPLFGDNGSGMHTHQSLWKEGTPLMADKSGYAGLSQLARARTSAACSPTRRRCSRSARRRRTRTAGSCPATRRRSTSSTRSATARRASGSRCTPTSPKAKRIEFRCPDPTANPYLAFSAMLMAGLDGIERGSTPGAPADYDLFEDDPRRVAQVPGSLAEALDALEADHAVPARGRRVQRGADPHLDRLQAGERGRRRPPPARTRPSSPSTTTAR